MKNSQALLFKTASKFWRKYAQSQSLEEILQNAASSGESSANGIMNFPAQLKKDQADLTLNIDIQSGTLSLGYDINVTATVTPSEVQSHYAALPGQIQNYLEKHINDFPGAIGMGPRTLTYSGRTPGGAGIASR